MAEEAPGLARLPDWAALRCCGWHPGTAQRGNVKCCLFPFMLCQVGFQGETEIPLCHTSNLAPTNSENSACGNWVQVLMSCKVGFFRAFVRLLRIYLHRRWVRRCHDESSPICESQTVSRVPDRLSVPFYLVLLASLRHIFKYPSDEDSFILGTSALVPQSSVNGRSVYVALACLPARGPVEIHYILWRQLMNGIISTACFPPGWKSLSIMNKGKEISFCLIKSQLQRSLPLH